MMATRPDVCSRRGCPSHACAAAVPCTIGLSQKELKGVMDPEFDEVS